MVFFLGVRVSTWAAAAAFLLLARRDRRFLAAGAAWLTGFETAFQVTSLSMGHPLPAWRWGPLFLIGLGLLVVPVVTRRGVRPAAWPMCLVGVFWLVWVATGFHVNGHMMHGLNPLSEALNETTKTLWAVAYLWPLLTDRRESRQTKRVIDLRETATQH